MSKKSRLAGLILLSMTIAYAVAIYTSIQNYNAWCKEKLPKYPEEVRPYVDFLPFWATKLGNFMVLICLAIVFSWIGFVYTISKPKPKASIFALTLTVFAVSFCLPPSQM